MEVRPGYKQTDMGVIPEDWEAVALGVIAGLDVGYAFSSAWFQKHDGVPLLRGENVGYGRPNWSDTRRLAETHAGAFGEYRLRPGDVVIGMDRTFTKSGTKISLVRDGDCPCLLVQRVGRFIPKRCDRRLLWAVLSSARFRQSLLAEQKGMDIPHLSRAEILRPLVAFPTRATEREAIAEALSDADALIESLEQILAKKRQIKQGAMQELLTGRRRLPGFTGVWEEKPLGQIAPLQRGFDLPRGKLRRGPFPVVYSNGILTHHAAFQVRGPGVATGRSGTIGNVTFIEQDFWPHNTALWVTSFKGNDPKFVFYLFVQVGLERFATGSGVPTLNRNDVHAFKIGIPADRGEQIAIAGILSDMDAEITTLEGKLARSRRITQGMMQELLTGRIRLV